MTTKFETNELYDQLKLNEIYFIQQKQELRLFTIDEIVNTNNSYDIVVVTLKTTGNNTVPDSTELKNIFSNINVAEFQKAKSILANCDDDYDIAEEIGNLDRGKIPALAYILISQMQNINILLNQRIGLCQLWIWNFRNYLKFQSSEYRAWKKYHCRTVEQ